MVEMIVAIVIVGIVTSMVIFIVPKSIESYLDISQRAALTDSADTALRRIAREVRLALPNSVRVSADQFAVELLPTKTGGRYRIADGGAGTDPLEFGGTDATSAFDVLGEPVTLAAGDQIVIYNLGIPGADAYSGNSAASDVRRAATNTGAVNNIAFAPATAFPFDSPTHRFHVVNTPITFICDAATRTLRRYWGYAIQTAQTTADTVAKLEGLTAAAGGGAILADNVDACRFIYDPGLTQSNGLLSMRLQLSSSNGETVNLFYQAHVNNAP